MPAFQGDSLLSAHRHNSAGMADAPRIYFAAPLFTAAERQWNAGIVADLQAAAPELAAAKWSIPQAFCAPFEGPNGVDHGAIYNACHEHLVAADIVIAVLDGSDVDSGTAWEAGFACASENRSSVYAPTCDRPKMAPRTAC